MAGGWWLVVGGWWLVVGGWVGVILRGKAPKNPGNVYLMINELSWRFALTLGLSNKNKQACFCSIRPAGHSEGQSPEESRECPFRRQMRKAGVAGKLVCTLPSQVFGQQSDKERTFGPIEERWGHPRGAPRR